MNPPALIIGQTIIGFGPINPLSLFYFVFAVFFGFMELLYAIDFIRWLIAPKRIPK
jgi:hypothetical protein